jgi:hypothetical protein
VRNFPDGIQFQKTGQSLDSVEGTEDGIDRFGVSRVVLQYEGKTLDGRQMFAGFQHKIGQQFRILRQRIGRGFWRGRRNGARIQGLLHGCHTAFELVRKRVARGAVL